MIEFPSLTQIQERLKNALTLSINTGQTDPNNQIDPNIPNSFIGGIADSMAVGFKENNDLIKEVLKQLFPQTATDEYLEYWASWFGITRKEAKQSEGYVCFTGTASTTILKDTLITRADDTQYKTINDVTIATQSISLSIARVGNIATATCGSAHNLATGISVTISGCNQSQYNITTTITVISETQFTFTVSDNPTTPATGSPIATFTVGYTKVQSINKGNNGNLAGGSTLSLVSPISGVDSNCYLDYNGFYNGVDIEDDESLRDRLLERTSNFTAPFTSFGIPIFIKEKISGVTRIWVKTATPTAGYVTIYFVRDNDINIIPSSQQTIAVKNAIIDLETGIKPANTPDSYVIVNAPTPVSIDVTFSSLSPNTVDMKNTIKEALQDYFKSDFISLGQDITLAEINALIYSVIDSEGNSPVFTLSSPSSTTSIADSELAVLGEVVFP